jgi:HEAT repeat protein
MYVLVGMILAALMFLALRPSEPVYQGKSLSAWLEDLNCAKGGEKHDLAAQAFRHAGANAVPMLVQILDSREPVLKGKLFALLKKLSLVRVSSKPPVDRLWKAVCAFRVLGPTAKPAIPALTGLCLKGRNVGYVTSALAEIGPDAAPPLMQLLTNQNPNVRFGAAAALQSLRSKAKAGGKWE